MIARELAATADDPVSAAILWAGGAVAALILLAIVVVVAHDKLKTPAPATPEPVQYIGGRFRFTCRICRQPSVATYRDPAEYLAVLTDPRKRQTCTTCAATLADLETGFAS